MNNTIIKKTCLALTTLYMSMVLVGCGDGDTTAGGPGTGGTGPIYPSIVTTSIEDLLVMDTNQVSAPDNFNGSDLLPTAPRPAPSGDDDVQEQASVEESNSIYSIRTLASSENKQICDGFERTISLVKNNLDTQKDSNYVNVSELELTQKKPLFIQITVKNTTDTNQMEVRSDCSSFTLQTSSLLTINEPVSECSTPSESLLYLPGQTHVYTANVSDLLTQPETEETYRLNYVNKIFSTSNTPVACNTFIELEIKKISE